MARIAPPKRTEEFSGRGPGVTANAAGMAALQSSGMNQLSKVFQSIGGEFSDIAARIQKTDIDNEISTSITEFSEYMTSRTLEIESAPATEKSDKYKEISEAWRNNKKYRYEASQKKTDLYLRRHISNERNRLAIQGFHQVKAEYHSNIKNDINTSIEMGDMQRAMDKIQFGLDNGWLVHRTKEYKGPENKTVEYWQEYAEDAVKKDIIDKTLNGIEVAALEMAANPEFGVDEAIKFVDSQAVELTKAGVPPKDVAQFRNILKARLQDESENADKELTTMLLKGENISEDDIMARSGILSSTDFKAWTSFVTSGYGQDSDFEISNKIDDAITNLQLGYGDVSTIRSMLIANKSNLTEEEFDRLRKKVSEDYDSYVTSMIAENRRFIDTQLLRQNLITGGLMGDADEQKRARDAKVSYDSMIQAHIGAKKKLTVTDLVEFAETAVVLHPRVRRTYKTVKDEKSKVSLKSALKTVYFGSVRESEADRERKYYERKQQEEQKKLDEAKEKYYRLVRMAEELNR